MKALITMPFSRSILSNFDSVAKRLEERGLEVEVDPRGRKLTEKELIDAWKGVYAHICSGDEMNANALRSADSLRIISRMGAGYDSVDLGTANELNIAVATTPGVNAPMVAEYAFTMILALSRKIVETDRRVRSGKWGINMSTSPQGKTLGIVGLGRIGKLLAIHARNFSMNVIAYDEYKDNDFACKHTISYCSLEEVLKNSDYVSVHVPASASTYRMLTGERISLMKPSAYIINCARGDVIDENALYEALTNNIISGAALDVYETEPLSPDSPLRGLENVILSSHTAGMTKECREQVFEKAVQNVLDYMDGVITNNIVNADHFKK